MPKRKTKTPVSNTQKIVAALMRVRQLHLPCKAENCQIDFPHCSGCNEPFPCKTIYAIEGTSPIRETITLEGEQSIEVVGSSDTSEGSE